MGLRSPFGNGPMNLSMPVPGSGIPTPPQSPGPAMRGPAGQPAAPQAQAPAEAKPSGMSPDEVAALNAFNQMSPDEVAALHAADEPNKMLVGANNGVADGLHKFMQEHFGAIRENKAGDKEIRIGSSWKKLSDGEWEALQTIGNVASETSKMGGMVAGAMAGAGAMIASAPETAGASAAAIPAATMAGGGVGYDAGAQLVRMAKAALGIEDEDKRSELLQHTMNFATGVLATGSGEAGSAMAQRFLGQQAGQYIGDQAGQDAIAAGAQVAAEKAQGRKNLSNETGVPLSADQIHGQPAPNFKNQDQVNQMNAFRENQRAQIISKLDEVRTRIAPRISEEEASNRSGLELVKGEVNRHETQVSPMIKKAQELSGDRQFDVSVPLDSMKKELSSFGVNFDKEGNIVGSVPSGEPGLGVMASRYQNLVNETRASAGGFAEEGHLIGTKEVHAFPGKGEKGEAHVQQSLGHDDQLPLFESKPISHTQESASSAITGSPFDIPMDQTKGAVPASNMRPNEVTQDTAVQPNLSGSKMVAQTTSIMPPNPAGKASRGITLRSIDAFTKDAQEFANLDKSDRSPVEKRWGKIQHEFRIVRDDAAALALEQRGNLGDAHALRNARNAYSQNINGLQDLQDQLEKDPTNFGAALVHEKDPVKTTANFQVINKMNPELLKQVRGGWLDSIVDPNIDKANNVVGATAIKKRLAQVDPKVLRTVMGDEGLADLRKIVNLAEIVENTNKSVMGPSDSPSLGKIASIYAKPGSARSWYEGGNFLSRLFSKQPGARDFIENNVKGYTFSPSSASKVAKPIPVPMGQALRQ